MKNTVVKLPTFADPTIVNNSTVPQGSGTRWSLAGVDPGGAKGEAAMLRDGVVSE